MTSEALFRFCAIVFQGRTFTVAKLSDALFCAGHKWADIVEAWESIGHRFDLVATTLKGLPTVGYRIKPGLIKR
jgi:hypothetical protein